MCGRYSSTLPRETIRTWFKVTGPIPDLPPRYNIAPSQPIPVVRVDRHGQRELAMMRWGLVPSWSPGPREQDFSMINARAETVATKPAFRRAIGVSSRPPGSTSGSRPAGAGSSHSTSIGVTAGRWPWQESGNGGRRRAMTRFSKALPSSSPPPTACSDNP